MATPTTRRRRYDLTKTRPRTSRREPFDNEVGFGQYPITVLDHANGMATFANDGVYNKAHFVNKVEKQDQDTGKWSRSARREAQAAAARSTRTSPTTSPTC